MTRKHHHHDHHEEYLGSVDIDRGVPGCDDQLPSISRVGRGLHGDDYRVEVVDKRPVDPLVSGWKDQSPAETYLEGKHFDHADKSWTTDWISENVSGGMLYYQMNLRPFTTPRTFTITFIYRRPENPLLPGEEPGHDPDEWSFTTEAIPYFPSTGDDGKPETDVVGSGIATLFLRKDEDSPWQEMLIYPDGTTREDYNAPAQGEAWTSNITLSDFIDWDKIITNDELAKVIGVTEETIVNIINGVPGAIDGSDNVKDYIDDQIDEVGDSITNLQQQITNLTQQFNAYKTYVNNALIDIINKINGGGTVGDDGNITWPNTDKIPTGDINIYSGGTSSNRGIFSHTGAAANFDLDFE